MKDELRNRVRRVFGGRIHKTRPKIEVISGEDTLKYKIIIAPYEPTVDKIVQLIQNDRLRLKNKLIGAFPEEKHIGVGVSKIEEYRYMGYDQCLKDVKTAIEEAFDER